MAEATILVVEDEEDILDLLAYNLEQAGFRVIRAKNGLEGLKRAQDQHPDLIVLDLLLPGLEGKEVCRRLRQQESTRDIPVIILTALSGETDRVVGFEIGADDYIPKPFSPRELVLRVKAVLRRTKVSPQPVGLIVRPGLTIDPSRHLVEVQGKAVNLTATEFKLLHFLASRAGRVQSREALLEKVWGYDYEGYARTVDTHVRRLRKKIGPLRDLVETLRGVGYRFKEER
jgi:two-component system phosphate regulon response regulator PhoB